jgi:hypothetical protein
LREKGHVFIYEAHPFVNNMIALPGEDAYDAQDELKIAYSYFRREPFVETDGLDYIGNTKYASKPAYSFPHTISAILMSILENNLTLLEFHEYPHDISTGFKHLEKYGLLPMCYTLIAQTQAR